MKKQQANAENLNDCKMFRKIKNQIKSLNDDLTPIEKRIKNTMINNNIDVLTDEDNVKVAEIKKIISIRFDEKRWKEQNPGWENGEYAKASESYTLRIL
ncbi:MAG: hypothetical protein MJZ15_04420 [Bacteroidales bacterium]|nr:hypothetical protein [Bacteroidales bacterium]